MGWPIVPPDVRSPVQDYEQLFEREQDFSSRPDIGMLPGLFERMARYFQGDPISPIVVSSTGVANLVSLPNEPRAKSAYLYVTAGAITWRVDGGQLVAGAGAQLATGASIVLTGQRSIQGFQFCSTLAGTTNVYGTYFD